MMMLQDTYKVAIRLGHQDIHLGALGADDLTAQRVFAQVDLASIRLVDGNNGDLSCDLDKTGDKIKHRAKKTQQNNRVIS